MSIDIFRKGDNRQTLFRISDEVYDMLENTAFATFQQRTGLYIDNYGDCLLTYQHAGLLQQLIKKAIDDKEIARSKPVDELINFLDNVVVQQTDIVLAGD
jgi:hypothetical protein